MEAQEQKYYELDQTVKQLIEVYFGYSGRTEGKRLEAAYELAKVAHEKQLRKTGEPYLVHPVAVMEILIDVQVDEDTLIAALLHDTVEDSDLVDLALIKEQFGQNVSLLVDGVTKLNKINFTSKVELQAENFRKMFLAMAKDIRVVLIKLADRLHNMRTMKHKEPDRQVAISRETLDVYTPLAHRLGIYKIKWELEDLCLRFIDPDAYYELVGAISQKRSIREKYLEDIVCSLNNKISDMGIEADIEGRPKHFYSIYRKMKAQNKGLDEIYDLFATRVIVPSIGDCYTVLGLVHELYIPMPARFKDYISLPKPNNYQSLHSTVIGPTGVPFEVQIRTEEMHRTAEYGIAAHWHYKEGGVDPVKLTGKHVDSKMTWLRQLLEWQHDMSDASEYMESLKTGLIPDEVFVFTPNGDVRALPAGSISVDFAYHIHSDVGNSMYSAKVNGKTEALSYELKNGDIVEILTSDNSKGPSRDWLNMVKSSTAKNKISTWFKREMREENIVRGKSIIEREIKRAGFLPSKLIKKQFYEKQLAKFSLASLNDLYAGVGYGGLSAGRIVPGLRDDYIRSLSLEERNKLGYTVNSRGYVSYRPKSILTDEKLIEAEIKAEDHNHVLRERTKRSKSDTGIVVQGIDNCLIKLSRCCSPVPGDSIIGYVTRGKGVTVHRTDCSNIKNLLSDKLDSPQAIERSSRLIDVFWDGDSRRNFHVDIKILAQDRRNLLTEISAAISEEQVTIVSARMQSAKDISATLLMTLEIVDQAQYDRVVGRIKAINSVVAVSQGY